MAMFFPSTYPSSRSPCLNASMRFEMAEREAPLRYPIRGIFFGCCARASTPAKTNVRTKAKIPHHFGFWIADFRLSEKESRNRLNKVLFMSFFRAAKSFLLPVAYRLFDHLI